jgi:RimJ/RimL family protein N-acetyltransferase
MKVPEKLKTKRLILRPYTGEDANSFLDSYKVMDPGFNLVISNKNSNAYLGTCGLRPIKDGLEVETIYALLPEFRGNGFAIEAMLKLMEHAFINLKILKIIAYIHPENNQGWKVAERIGLKYMGHVHHKEFIPKAMLFTLTKNEYLAQRSY